jgi:hypothetical protein
MNFFFDYIYYRITQWKFNTQGSTSATALGLISLMQLFLLELIIQPLLKYCIAKNILIINVKQFGGLAAVIAIVLLILNYIIYRGRYEGFKLYWKDESPRKRFIKGILVVLSIFLPMILFILLNNHSN